MLDIFNYVDDTEVETLEPVFKTRVVSDQTRMLQSMSAMNHAVSQKTRNIIGDRYRGKKLSKEHRANMRKSRIGNRHSEETIAKMRESAKSRAKRKAKFIWHTPLGAFTSSQEAAVANSIDAGSTIRKYCDDKNNSDYFREIAK
jgi:hypothetical protein